MRTILFQGDSITDVDRDRNCDDRRGLGYPTLIAGELGYEAPGAFTFLNRGVSGDRVVDLYARIKRDVINLRPDVMSILIGVNDVWHELSSQNGVSAEKYRKVYGMYVEEILAALPNVRILVLEPFVLHGPATDGSWDYFRKEVALRAEAARDVVETYGLTFVPLQRVFDAALEKADASYWTPDGVHPTTFGHELIAREWIRAFRSLN